MNSIHFFGIACNISCIYTWNFVNSGVSNCPQTGWLNWLLRSFRMARFGSSHVLRVHHGCFFQCLISTKDWRRLLRLTYRFPFRIKTLWKRLGEKEQLVTLGGSRQKVKRKSMKVTLFFCIWCCSVHVGNWCSYISVFLFYVFGEGTFRCSPAIFVYHQGELEDVRGALEDPKMSKTPHWRHLTDTICLKVFVQKC